MSKDLADSIEELLKRGDFNPCCGCVRCEECNKYQTYCVDVIKAKVRGVAEWDPKYKEVH